MLLVIDKKESELALEGTSLVIRVSNKRINTLPIDLIDHIVFSKKVNVDTSLLATLADQNISLSVFGGRFMQHSAFIINATATLALLRKKQYKIASSPENTDRIVRIIINAKTRSQIRFLDTQRASRPQHRYALSKAITQLGHSIQRMRENPPTNRARGIEGANAATYFECLILIMPSKYGFQKRIRRPPPDPVNAVLSLGYTLLYHQAIKHCQEKGLDPLCGYLHDALHGRSSLAADIIEAERVTVDQFTLKLFTEKWLSPQHFISDKETQRCQLNKEGRSIFYYHYSLIREPLNQRLTHLTARLRRGIEKWS